MAKAKYKQYYERMVEQHKAEFDKFRDVHDQYDQDQTKYQATFNEEGEKIMEIVREWENKLCMQSEKGGYGNFTNKLAEKFQAELKKHYPLIDHVGLLVIQEDDKESTSDEFVMKQIKLL